MEQKQAALARQWTEYENYHAEKKRQKTCSSGPALFQSASFQIANKSRVAIVGDNGAGKTTLLHLICAAAGEIKAGTVAPETGSISVVPKARIGVFEQNLSTYRLGLYKDTDC